jgi:hypothetical protein
MSMCISEPGSAYRCIQQIDEGIIHQTASVTNPGMLEEIFVVRVGFLQIRVARSLHPEESGAALYRGDESIDVVGVIPGNILLDLIIALLHLDRSGELKGLDCMFEFEAAVASCPV